MGLCHGKMTETKSTSLGFFKLPFLPAKYIRELLARRRRECVFGYSTEFAAHYELGEEVGRGHFSHTCSAKPTFKGLDVVVKITRSIAVEDVSREVQILRALRGHKNLVNFYDAYEDESNVYLVMELCRGGDLLDRIHSRGGKYPEEDAKAVMVQILSVTAYFHLQGVVHRDIKPEEDNATLKAIDFGLSDYAKPGERLNDIVGTTYCVAPEVLHRFYGAEAHMWSIGLIAYMLLCGSRPFWSRTESGIFRAPLKADPSFDEYSWSSLSSDAMDFVKRLLNKDYRKRLTASQALSHPWLANHHDAKIPFDMIGDDIGS